MRTIDEIKKKVLMSRNHFSEMSGYINLKSGRRKLPEYLVKLLERVVREDYEE